MDLKDKKHPLVIDQPDLQLPFSVQKSGNKIAALPISERVLLAFGGFMSDCWRHWRIAPTPTFILEAALYGSKWLFTDCCSTFNMISGWDLSLQRGRTGTLAIAERFAG